MINANFIERPPSKEHGGLATRAHPFTNVEQQHSQSRNWISGRVAATAKLRKPHSPQPHPHGKQAGTPRPVGASAPKAMHQRLATGESARAGEFTASPELIAVVVGSIRKKIDERKALHKFAASSSSAAAVHQFLEHSQEAVDVERMGAYIGEKVTDFFATLGQGVALSSAEDFPLTANGRFLEPILLGFSSRIPVSYIDLAAFDLALVANVKKYAKGDFQVGQSARVILTADDELALRPLESVEAIDDEHWERATVYMPG